MLICINPLNELWETTNSLYDLEVNLMSMHESNEITFVIASYNDEDLLEKTVESIVNNSRVGDKIIVIDGASQDGTVDTLVRLKKEIPTLDFESAPDRGIYDAWNKSIEKTKSPWVSFLGCGDVLRPDYREKMVEAISRDEDSNYIYGISQMFLWDQGFSSIRYLRTFGKEFCAKEFRIRMRVSHVGSLHHKSLFENRLFSTDYRCVSDYLFLLESLPELKPAFIDSIVVDMEASGISQSSIFPIIEEFKMKRELGGYKTRSLLARLIWSCLKFYLFKGYEKVFFNKTAQYKGIG